MIACPNCKRRIFTARDMFYAGLDGAARCRACGKFARLDVISRWMLACMIAIILPMVLLYGNVFYSGHLFIVSLAVILCTWRVLSALGLPILSLELIPRQPPLTQRQSVCTLAIIVVAALIMDGFMAYRIDAEEAQAKARAASAVVKPR